MNSIDSSYNEFILDEDYKEIEKENIETAQLIQIIHLMVNAYGVPCYPKFRDNHRSSTGLKVYNMKILYPEREEWDNAATVHPHRNFLDIFTFKEGEEQEHYFLSAKNRECKYCDKIVPLEKLFDEIKGLYKLRARI